MTEDFDVDSEPIPFVVDWRFACAKCGRFVAKSAVGEIYAPYGPNLEYDAYEARTECPRCGRQRVNEVVVRIEYLSCATLGGES